MMISVIKKHRGASGAFTLIEILIAITILLVLAATAIPGLKNAASNIQLDASSGKLQNFMNYLRQEAITGSRVITLSEGDMLKKCSARGLTVKSDRPEVRFYPDGRIEPVEITLTAQNGARRRLTTKGVFGAVKLLPRE